MNPCKQEEMLLTLLLTGFLFEASASQIVSHGNVTAIYGGDALYGCSLANPAGVLQITWQRVFKDESFQNLATYSKRFGQQVNEPFQEKVIFTEASLNSTAITLKNVTWEDDSCYICSFNAYPDGSKMKQTCLTVQGISEVRSSVQPPRREHEDVEEVVVSCSATGKPAPTIEWAYSPGASPVSQPQAITATNSDQTSTSSRNVTVRVPLDWSGYLDCVLNSGMTGEKRERIPFSSGPGHGKKRGVSSVGLALGICAVVFLVCVTVGLAMMQKRLKSNRNILYL